jgi:hypothetical protein
MELRLSFRCRRLLTGHLLCNDDSRASMAIWSSVDVFSPSLCTFEVFGWCRLRESCPSREQRQPFSTASLGPALSLKPWPASLQILPFSPSSWCRASCATFLICEVRCGRGRGMSSQSRTGRLSSCVARPGLPLMLEMRSYVILCCRYRRYRRRLCCDAML